ncbi:MAG: hypothetical protein KBA66_00340 [Leptospiraceae bacterium]|nr:hypothetical protein [Leptospiraceae bacterium]
MIKLKTYQLFIIITAPFIIAIIYAIGSMQFFNKTIMFFLLFIWYILVYIWIIDLLVRFNSKMNDGNRLSGKISIAIIFFNISSSIINHFYETPILFFLAFLFFPPLGGIFILRTLAKNLRTLELNREAVASEYMAEFNMFWFFPVGIWNLHPRILKVLNTETSTSKS